MEHISGAFVAIVYLKGIVEIKDPEFKNLLLTYNFNFSPVCIPLAAFWVGELEVLAIYATNPPWHESNLSATYGLILVINQAKL